MPLSRSRQRQGQEECRNAPNNVFVVELHEEGDLTDGGGWDALLLSLKLDFLEGDHFVGGELAGLVHGTVGALTNLLNLLIVLHLQQ